MSTELDKILDSALGVPPEPTKEPAPLELPRSLSDLQREMEQESYGWAADVYWVYRHLGQKPSKIVAGGLNGRYQLWKHAKANMQRFMDQTLPRAMTLLEKAKAKQDEGLDTIIDEEGKSIRKLQGILQKAVIEAEQMKHE